MQSDVYFYYVVAVYDRLGYNWMSGGFQLRPRVQEPYDYVQKIIIIGDSGVGKSNILLRYTEGKFAENYLVTIGMNYAYKIVEVGGVKLKLQIWDTAGQEKYRTITKTYYRNSQGVIVVFGLDSRDSFRSIRTFISIQMAGLRISFQLPPPPPPSFSSAIRQISMTGRSPSKKPVNSPSRLELTMRSAVRKVDRISRIPFLHWLLRWRLGLLISPTRRLRKSQGLNWGQSRRNLERNVAIIDGFSNHPY